MRLNRTGQLTRAALDTLCAALDTLYEEGIFYNPTVLGPDEIAVHIPHKIVPSRLVGNDAGRGGRQCRA
jgi:hypothetical protein